MNTENILVPFDRNSSDLKGLYHAFSLAERIRAKVFVLFFTDDISGHSSETPLQKACLEMVHSACEEGKSVSFHLAGTPPETELRSIIKTEHIDLIVIDAGDTRMKSVIRDINAGLSIQILEVKGKYHY